MSNNEILEKLMGRYPNKEEEHSDNAEVFRKNISKWDDNEFEFPYIDLRQYIRFNEWTKKDFSFENELLIVKKLPPFVHDIYFEMKEFRDNARNELTSLQRSFARLNGFPDKTQDEKAFCIYDYAFKRYFEDSELHQGE